MSYELKLLFGGLSVTLTIAAFIPYLRAILRGRVKPHVFSWVIWSVTTFIIFFAQLDAEGGVGAWPTAMSAVMSVVIAVLAYIKRADISITKIDWGIFVVGLATLPFWYFTSDPLWAVVILTSVDFLGFGPTIRKTFYFPHDESASYYVIYLIKNVFAVLALQHYSTTTLLFPLMLISSSFILMNIIYFRRKIIGKPHPNP